MGGVQAESTDPPAVWLERSSSVEGPEAWVAKDDLLDAHNREGAKDGRPNLTKQAMTQPRVSRPPPSQRTTQNAVKAKFAGGDPF